MRFVSESMIVRFMGSAEEEAMVKMMMKVLEL